MPLPPQSKKWGGGGAHAPLAPPLPTPVLIKSYMYSDEYIYIYI